MPKIMSLPEISALPVAAVNVLPMMTDAQLDELAEDIKANGLIDPIAIAEVNGEKVLVDGKNRRAACVIAGVEPAVRYLEKGEGLGAFFLSTNILHRKHRTKSQLAIGWAKMD